MSAGCSFFPSFESDVVFATGEKSGKPTRLTAVSPHSLPIENGYIAQSEPDDWFLRRLSTGEVETGGNLSRTDKEEDPKLARFRRAGESRLHPHSAGEASPMASLTYIGACPVDKRRSLPHAA